MAPDIRNERTERAIADAFLEELAKKPLAGIAVSSVAHRAGISRSTFYAHYSNTRDVFEHIVAEFVGSIRELNVQLRCASCGNDSPDIKGKLPFCIALRSAGRYDALVRCPEFLPAYLDLVNNSATDVILEDLIASGIQPDIARNVMRFQQSGCYAVAMESLSDSDWSLSQAALDTYISGGITALRKAAGNEGGRLRGR